MDLNEQADKDFSRARRRAFLKRVGAYLRRDPASNTLLSFDEVRSALGAVEQSYLGMRVVPVAKVVGQERRDAGGGTPAGRGAGGALGSRRGMSVQRPVLRPCNATA